MEGFFPKTTVQSNVRLEGLTGCAACGLHRSCLSPRMPATGRGEKGILVITSAPGETEDVANKQLVGKTGEIVRKKFSSFGINLDRDCRKINAVNCRPPQDKQPTSEEIGHCRPRVWEEINNFKPRMIILFGGDAVESFLGGRWKKNLGGINKWRGWTIPDRDAKAWVCPTFTPSYVQNSVNKHNDVVDVVFDQDLNRFFSKLEEPVPTFLREESMVKKSTNPREIYNFLQNILEWQLPIAIDYETTGLKPQRPGHKVKSCSISISGDEAFAFPITDSALINNKLIEILQHPNIGKIAHNMKFEDTWSNVFFKTYVKLWLWDTQLSTHIIDNRSGITSLKFQAYVNYGIPDYDSEIEPLLEAGESEVGNGFNRIDEIPLMDLLTYNGMDTIFTYRLFQDHMRKISNNALKS